MSLDEKCLLKGRLLRPKDLICWLKSDIFKQKSPLLQEKKKEERKTEERKKTVQTISTSICVTDFPEVSSTACQHYSLITLQRSVPGRLVNARQKLLDFWSSVHLTCGSTQTCFLLCSSLVRSSFLHELFMLI